MISGAGASGPRTLAKTCRVGLVPPFEPTAKDKGWWDKSHPTTSRGTILMMRAVCIVLLGALMAFALPQGSRAQDLQALLQENAELVTDASRRTVGEVLDILVDSGLPEVPQFLETWGARELYVRDSDGLFVYVQDEDADPLVLIDIITGEASARQAPAR